MDFEVFNKRIWLATATKHDEELQYIKEAFDTNWITTEGTNINEIERQISEKVGCKYAVALTNGTAALHLAAKLAGVKLYPEKQKPRTARISRHTGHITKSKSSSSLQR